MGTWECGHPTSGPTPSRVGPARLVLFSAKKKTVFLVRPSVFAHPKDCGSFLRSIHPIPSIRMNPSIQFNQPRTSVCDSAFGRSLFVFLNKNGFVVVWSFWVCSEPTNLSGVIRGGDFLAIHPAIHREDQAKLIHLYLFHPVLE